MIKITEQDLIDNLIKQITDQKNQRTQYSESILRISGVELDFKFNFENILVQAIQPYEGRKSKMECSYNIEFSNCIFNQNVILRNTAFSQNVILNDIVFNQGVNFSYTDFNQVVDFTRVIFEKNVIVEDTNFNGYTLFESVEFKMFEDEDNKRIFKNVNFKEITCCNSYMRNITFEKCNFEELNVYKRGNDINNFSYPTEFNKVEFTHCEFKKLLLGKSIIRDCLFNKSTIIEEANFYKHPLPENVNNVLDTSTIIDNSKFIEVDFQKEGDFKTVIFENQVEFVRCRFGDRGAFWNCSFNTLIFENIRLEDKSHIYFGETKGAMLQLVSSVLLGRIDFNNDDIKKLNLFGSVVRGTLNRIKFNAFKCENKETACILKDEELKRNNTIQALEYQAEEKKLLEIELNANKTWSNWADRFSLYLGKVFHNHGQNWLLALGWTILIWIGTFAVFSLPNPIYYINSELNIFCSYWGVLTSKEFWGDLVKYISPTEYELLSIYIKTSSAHGFIKFLGIVVYFIGKIFIPYGVYEVIKAFRKYK